MELEQVLNLFGLTTVVLERKYFNSVMNINLIVGLLHTNISINIYIYLTEMIQFSSQIRQGLTLSFLKSLSNLVSGKQSFGKTMTHNLRFNNVT